MNILNLPYKRLFHTLTLSPQEIQNRRNQCRSLNPQLIFNDKLSTNRRTILFVGTLFTTTLFQQHPSKAVTESSSSPTVRTVVSPTTTGNVDETHTHVYNTISDALDESQPGDTIQITPGRYTERFIITKPNITIQSIPNNNNETNTADQRSQEVIIEWATKNPYESTITCSASNITLQGLTIRHASPSIANNYAIYLMESSGVKASHCNISSSTGSGICIEGATYCEVDSCLIHDCARNGILISDDILGGGDGGGGDDGDTLFNNNKKNIRIVESIIESNALHGIIVRDGASPTVISNTIRKNGGYGLVLQGCSGEYRDNSFVGNTNRGGDIAYNLLVDGTDANEISRLNGLCRIQNKKI